MDSSVHVLLCWFMRHGMHRWYFQGISCFTGYRLLSLGRRRSSQAAPSPPAKGGNPSPHVINQASRDGYTLLLAALGVPFVSGARGVLRLRKRPRRQRVHSALLKVNTVF